MRQTSAKRLLSSPHAAHAALGVAVLLLLAVTSARGQEAEGRFATIDAYVEEQRDGSRIPGVAVAIVEGGQTVHSRGFGEDGRGNAITPQTPFWIGSNTKSFTALAVMQLVEAGLVELDAPIQRYLPEFAVADAEASARITVRHLLNQTSGFSRADGIEMVAEAKEQTLEAAVASFRDLELNRAVGERFEYSNPNFVVLGLLIERVSGQRWPDYIGTNIFEPLQMTDSYATLDDARAGSLTATHRYWFGLPVATEGTYLEGLAPTGYLYSSAEDLARYLAMYLRGGELDGARVLSEAGIDEMHSPGADFRVFELQGTELRAQYGAGWFIGPFGAAEDAIWHGGTLPHFIAWIVLLPETDQAAVVLINASHQLAIAGANEVFIRIPMGVVNLLRGEAPPTGISLSRFYLGFNAFVLAATAVQVWSLVRVVRGPAERVTSGVRRALQFVPLLWELGAALALLVLVVSSWPAVSASTPDLAWTVVVVASLWLVTGIARGVRLLRRQPRTQGGRIHPAEAEAAT